MAFVVKHTPVAGLVETAVRASAAQQARTREAQDFARQQQQRAQEAQLLRAREAQDASYRRQQAATQAQMAQAQMAQDIRTQEVELRKRATALQEASAARMARTPTARAAAVSPVALAIQARLAELDKLKKGGGLADPVYQEARLRVITGSRAPQAPRPKGPSAVDVRRDRQERAKVVTGIEQLRALKRNPKLTPAQREQLIGQEVEIVGRATERWGPNWASEVGLPIELDLPTEPGVSAQDIQSLPYDPANFRRGVTYVMPDGRLGRWTGPDDNRIRYLKESR